jgi:hypothetical protein
MFPLALIFVLVVFVALLFVIFYYVHCLLSLHICIWSIIMFIPIQWNTTRCCSIELWASCSSREIRIGGCTAICSMHFPNAAFEILHPLLSIFIYRDVALPWGVYYFSLFLFKNMPYIKNPSKERHISEIYVLWHTGIGQNNGNTTDTVHISLLIWCWTTFCLQHSHNPWNGLVRVLNSL